MGVRPEDYVAFIPPLSTMTNVIGALAAMPYKIITCDLVQRLSPAATITGACDAIRHETDDGPSEDMSDGDGFALGLRRKGSNSQRTWALMVSSGEIRSVAAVSLAAVGVSALALYDARPEVAYALAGRLHQYYPQLDITLMQHDPVGHELIVNITPLGMKASDPLPLDTGHLAPDIWVGETVMTQEYTSLLGAAQVWQCHIQHGTDVLFEMIPAYLRFFDLPVATPEQLRALMEVHYWRDDKPGNIALYYPVYNGSL